MPIPKRSVLFLAAACFFFVSFAHAATLVAANSDEGLRRLERAEQKADFIPLANHFEGQAKPPYCGVATSVVVINALYPSRHLTQDTFFNADTDRIKTKAQVLGEPSPDQKPDYGFQLSQLKKVLEARGLNVQARIVIDEVSEKAVRQDFISNLAKQGDALIINYYRPALGQEGGGHISPVGAYDKTSDSVLIMDVNSQEREWVWATVHDLVQAMKTWDTVENRGYLLVSN